MTRPCFKGLSSSSIGINPSSCRHQNHEERNQQHQGLHLQRKGRQVKSMSECACIHMCVNATDLLS
eukprot:m.385565 g.385565  ORF g.385565 m.385565 type:complete len:66 (+) comp56284_c0_seq4:537-734(+)